MWLRKKRGKNFYFVVTGYVLNPKNGAKESLKCTFISVYLFLHVNTYILGGSVVRALDF